MTRGIWHLVGAMMLATAACGGSRPAGGQAPPGPALAAQSAAQGASGRGCATPDDSTGNSISATFRARAEEVYPLASAALRELGYAVLENVPPKELMTAPSYTWPAGSANESWHGPEHPGIELTLFARSAGDSTTVTIVARALCRVAGAAGGTRDSQVGANLESITAIIAMNGLMKRLRSE